MFDLSDVKFYIYLLNVYVDLSCVFVDLSDLYVDLNDLLDVYVDFSNVRCLCPLVRCSCPLVKSFRSVLFVNLSDKSETWHEVDSVIGIICLNDKSSNIYIDLSYLCFNLPDSFVVLSKKISCRTSDHFDKWKLENESRK
jgi:hypothetical protein